MNRRRLVIHPGMPKTGTSALQRFLWENRDTLSRNGWVYPDHVISEADPRHQFLYTCFYRRRFRALVKCINETSGDIILSTEGICTHLFGLDEHSPEFLDATAGLSVEVVVVHREKTAWLQSLYAQVRKNGNTTTGFEEFCQRDGIRLGCDQRAVNQRLRSLFGARVTRLDYDANDAVQPFLQHLGISQTIWAAPPRRVNESTPIVDGRHPLAPLTASTKSLIHVSNLAGPRTQAEEHLTSAPDSQSVPLEEIAPTLPAPTSADPEAATQPQTVIQ